jgi:hypothetical protein
LDTSCQIKETRWTKNLSHERDGSVKVYLSF